MQKKYYYIYIILIVDIISKYFIKNTFYLHEEKIIFSFLNIFYTHNYGAAFSILSNQNGWQIWFLSIISTIAIISIFYIISNTNKKYTTKITAYIFIVSGALGNLIDRILHGFVIDFIDIHIYNYHYAIFNIADCSIFIGINIIIIINVYNLYQNKIKNT